MYEINDSQTVHWSFDGIFNLFKISKVFLFHSIVYTDIVIYQVLSFLIEF